jgi:hypothetical protein
MINLSGLYWGWKEKKRLKLEELNKEQEEKKRLYSLYGKYIDQASESSYSTLYTENKGLTQLYVECIESGVKSVANGEHYTVAHFNNGCRVRFWTANKMFGYACSSVFTLESGEVKDFGGKNQPSLWCAYMILDKVENFQK